MKVWSPAVWAYEPDKSVVECVCVGALTELHLFTCTPSCPLGYSTEHPYKDIENLFQSWLMAKEQAVQRELLKGSVKIEGSDSSLVNDSVIFF